MKLPIIETSEAAVGLYAIDLEGQCASGLSAGEVALLLESQRCADAKVYRIRRVKPDGSMELEGVSASRFQLETGMIFHGRDERSVEQAFERLTAFAANNPAPCRAKFHLAREDANHLALALIYPAEYDQAICQWLIGAEFGFDGPIDGGVSAVEQYYRNQLEVVRREQFWPAESQRTRDLETLQGLLRAAQ